MLEWLREHPGSNPFLVIGERTWTYVETVAEVESRMVDEMVVVRPRSDSESVFALLAGMSGGGALVLPPELGDGFAALTPPSPAEAADGPPTSGGTKKNPPPSPAEAADGPPTSGGTKLVVFTSGTSGPPKGVRLTMANLEAAAKASVEHLGHGPDDRWLLAMPLHHVGGISILVRSAYAGGSVHMAQSFAPVPGVTMASVVPTMLSRLLDHDAGTYPELKAVLVGGGPIPARLLERASLAGVPALPTYGMTETFGQVATLRPGSEPERKAHPLPGVEIRIESDGRIAVAGGQVSPGYINEPDRPDRWLVTNDLGVLEDGALRVLGRADSVIISGGENVSPERVEAELHSHPEIEEVVVFGVPDSEWGELVCCLYAGTAAEGDLKVWLRSRLPGHLVPKVWKRVVAIPVTGPGKPDRKKAAELI